MSNQEKMQELLSTLETLRRAKEILEIRLLRTNKGTISGYFDDYKLAVESIEQYFGKHDIYFTLNPPKEDLLARCKNRLQNYAKKTTSDGDIERIKYILVDLDPVRASGISATDEEKKSAYDLIKIIRKELTGKGFAEPIVADSGNGYHLLLPTDLENTKENVLAIKDFLAALDFRHSTDKVHVDLTTFNPSRIVKFYGTKACKGDDTEDRPHRHSKFIKVPKELGLVTLNQIQDMALKKPGIGKAPKQKGKGTNESLDINAFIEKHGLDLAYSAPYGTKATKYILKTCPWNSDHTDKAAFIIQFDNGAISAGCHHNSCSDQSWKTLRELLNDVENASENNDKQADVIMKLTEDFTLFVNDLDEPYAAYSNKGHMEVVAMKSDKFLKNLTRIYFAEKEKVPSADHIKQAAKVLEMKASYSDNVIKLHRRIAEVDQTYYYDLCDPKWRVVKFDESGCSILDKPPILFTRSKNMQTQLDPDLTVDPKQLPEIVRKHFRFKKDSDLLLFTVYLVSCFLPQIAHVILVLFGEKGAAKSTTMRMIKKIVDPAMQDLLCMPTTKGDLAILLNNNYMPSFDNLDSLSAEKSDMLCMSATGGAFSKRTLFTDSDETILRLRRCVALNGINVVATRSDLLDRSILLELDRILKTERKTENAIWKSFEQDLPKILGAIFNTISKAIPLYSEEKLAETGRMADFTCWGYAIAQALGLDGEEFIKAYISNQDTANEEALGSHPVGAAVIALMYKTDCWSSSVSELLKKLEDIAFDEHINTKIKTWPKDPNILSQRLKEIKSNLEEIGIFYDVRNAGKYRKITIERYDRDNKNEVVDQKHNEQPQQISYEMDSLFPDDEMCSTNMRQRRPSHSSSMMLQRPVGGVS